MIEKPVQSLPRAGETKTTRPESSYPFEDMAMLVQRSPPRSHFLKSLPSLSVIIWIPSLWESRLVRFAGLLCQLDEITESRGKRKSQLLCWTDKMGLKPWLKGIVWIVD